MEGYILIGSAVLAFLSSCRSLGGSGVAMVGVHRVPSSSRISAREACPPSAHVKSSWITTTSAYRAFCSGELYGWSYARRVALHIDDAVSAGQHFAS